MLSLTAANVPKYLQALGEARRAPKVIINKANLVRINALTLTGMTPEAIAKELRLDVNRVQVFCPKKRSRKSGSSF